MASFIFLYLFEKSEIFMPHPVLRWMGCGGMDWIDLAQERDRWLVVVNAAMNLRVP